MHAKAVQLFISGKITSGELFALHLPMQKYRKGRKELHCVFLDLQKAYDRVLKDELWYCMRKLRTKEKYANLDQGTYTNSFDHYANSCKTD